MGYIQHVTVDDSEIATIIEAIGKATTKHSENATVLGCLAAAIVLCHPGITKAKLGEGVRLISEKLALWIDNEDIPTTIH